MDTSTLRMFVLVAMLLVLLPAAHSQDAPDSYLPIQSIPLCRSLPYNRTRLPNKLGHTTLKEVNDSINDYRQLIDAGCSKSLVFLLCVYHLPIFTLEPEFKNNPILPCRSLCRQVKRECANIIRNFSNVHQQPRRDVDCNNLPAYETGVCVKPESFIQNGDNDPSARARDMGVCQCSQPIIRKKNSIKKFKFAIKARVILINQTSPSSNRTIVVNVRKVLKVDAVKVSRGKLHLRTDTSCACPPVQVGQMYLLMGYEDTSQQELILNEKSFAETWRKRFPRPLGKQVEEWKRAKHHKRGGKKKPKGKN